MVVGLALVYLAGGVRVTGGSTPPPTESPPATIATVINARVHVRINHVGDRTWLFRYTLLDAGSTPIGGFQISGPRSRLFDVVQPKGWVPTGGGICGQPSSTVLVYWSTGSAGVLQPGQTAYFSFKVRTAGPTALGYSVAWQTAVPEFGTISGPQGSNLRAPGCYRRG